MNMPWPPRAPILVIDDDPHLLELWRDVWSEDGADVYVATDRDEALQVVRSRPGPWITLLDWQMPGVDIEALVADLRAYQPDILIVGLSSLDRAEEFRAVGVYHFLAKDTPQRLARRVGIAM